jgi:diguanylate cyclase (GGDEF)-like protein
VTDLLVIIAGGSAADAAPLLDRLTSMGFRCSHGAGPVSAPEGAPAVMLRIDAGRGSAPPPGIPLLRLGAAGQDGGEDEVLPPDIGDAALARRLRVWGRWSLAARGGGPLEGAGSAPPGGSSRLPGHKAFVERLAEEIKRHERYDAPLGLVLADIDGLREINTRYGHRTGDRVIREVGDTLSEAVRASDRVFHYGGDTFAVLLTHTTAEATLRAVSRLRSVFTSLILRGDPEGAAPPPLLKISMSFGQVALPEAGVREPDELVAAAERSLAAARSGAPGATLPTGKP